MSSIELTPEWTAYFKQGLYLIKGTCIIYCDYPKMKTLLDPVIYDIAIQYFIIIIQQALSTHQRFELHLNFKSFTVTSAEKSVKLVQSFCKECVRIQVGDDTMASKMTKLVIYNTPSVITTIMSILSKFADPDTRHRFMYIQDKDESIRMIREIHDSK